MTKSLPLCVALVSSITTFTPWGLLLLLLETKFSHVDVTKLPDWSFHVLKYLFDGQPCSQGSQMNKLCYIDVTLFRLGQVEWVRFAGAQGWSSLKNGSWGSASGTFVKDNEVELWFLNRNHWPLPGTSYSDFGGSIIAFLFWTLMIYSPPLLSQQGMICWPMRRIKRWMLSKYLYLLRNSIPRNNLLPISAIWQLWIIFCSKSSFSVQPPPECLFHCHLPGNLK